VEVRCSAMSAHAARSLPLRPSSAAGRVVSGALPAPGQRARSGAQGSIASSAPLRRGPGTAPAPGLRRCPAALLGHPGGFPCYALPLLRIARLSLSSALASCASLLLLPSSSFGAKRSLPERWVYDSAGRSPSLSASSPISSVPHSASSSKWMVDAISAAMRRTLAANARFRGSVIASSGLRLSSSCGICLRLWRSFGRPSRRLCGQASTNTTH